MNLKIIGCAAVMGLSGCTVGPDYERPTDFTNQVTPSQFVYAREGDAADQPMVDWWRQLGDEVLNDLIAQAFENNRDIAVAVANLRASRAALSINLQDNLPFTSVGGSYQRQRTAGASLAFSGPGIPLVFPDQNFFDVGVDTAWEIDVFGGIRRGVEGARAAIVAAQATRDDLFVSVAAETAQAYIDLRGAQLQLDVAMRNRENQEKTLALTKTLLRAGRGTQLDVDRALTQLATTQSTIPPFNAAVNVAIQRLGVLTGAGPNAFQDLLERPKAFPDIITSPNLMLGDPPSLLRRRPDIRRAEANLAQATAEIGVATAELFPIVSVVGNVGFQSLTTDRLFGTGSLTYGVGPSIQWNFLDYFRIRQRIKQAESFRDADLAAYEQTVLLALEETESALTQYINEIERFRSLQVAAEAAMDAARLSTLRYRNGVDNFLTVLDAERVQLSTEDLLAVSQIEVARQFIAIYKALGGGWEVAYTNRPTVPFQNVSRALPKVTNASAPVP